MYQMFHRLEPSLSLHCWLTLDPAYHIFEAMKGKEERDNSNSYYKFWLNLTCCSKSRQLLRPKKNVWLCIKYDWIVELCFIISLPKSTKATKQCTAGHSNAESNCKSIFHFRKTTRLLIWSIHTSWHGRHFDYLSVCSFRTQFALADISVPISLPLAAVNFELINWIFYFHTFCATINSDLNFWKTNGVCACREYVSIICERYFHLTFHRVSRSCTENPYITSCHCIRSDTHWVLNRWR